MSVKTARQRHHHRAHPRLHPAANNAALARELGIHSRTVARWKGRPVESPPQRHRPLDPAAPAEHVDTQWEEALVVELPHGSSPWAEGPRSLALPLDDIVEAMRRCLNPELSRSAIHRCLQRHAISARLTPEKASAVTFHTDAPPGFIHIDVKYLPPLNRRRSYAYVALDRATRFVSLEIRPIAAPSPPQAFLPAFSTAFRLRSTPF